MQKITIEITAEQAHMILGALCYQDQNTYVSGDPEDEEQNALEEMIRGELKKIGKWD